MQLVLVVPRLYSGEVFTSEFIRGEWKSGLGRMLNKPAVAYFKTLSI